MNRPEVRLAERNRRYREIDALFDAGMSLNEVIDAHARQYGLSIRGASQVVSPRWRAADRRRAITHGLTSTNQS